VHAVSVRSIHVVFVFAHLDHLIIWVDRLRRCQVFRCCSAAKISTKQAWAQAAHASSSPKVQEVTKWTIARSPAPDGCPTSCCCCCCCPFSQHPAAQSHQKVCRTPYKQNYYQHRPSNTQDAHFSKTPNPHVRPRAVLHNLTDRHVYACRAESQVAQSALLLKQEWLCCTVVMLRLMHQHQAGLARNMEGTLVEACALHFVTFFFVSVHCSARC
jgi:hypothetical protein